MRAILVLLLLVGGMSGAAAEIYKWTDAQGRVHYGDKPGAKQAKEMALPESQPTGVGVSEDRAEQEKRLLDAWEQERIEAREAADRKAKDDEQRRVNCVRARDYLRGIREAGALYDLRPDGSRRVLTDDERAQAEASAQAAVERYCTD